MSGIHILERAMTDAEFARMNAGFDDHTIELGNPIQTSERYGFVALEGNCFVGCSSGLAYKNGPNYSGWFYLSDLFIEKAYRGQGLGSTLLLKLERLVAELGVRDIWTWTGGHEAHAFYVQKGYVVFCELEHWYESGHSRIGLRKRLRPVGETERGGSLSPPTAP